MYQREGGQNVQCLPVPSFTSGKDQEISFLEAFYNFFSETGVYCDSALLNLAKHFMMNITAHGTYFVFRVIEMQLDKSSQSDIC